MIEPVYAGSFDPITYGHLDVIKQTVKMFGHINIFIASNPDKNGMFSPDERKNIIWDALKEEGIDKRCFVFVCRGLVVDFARYIACGDNVVLVRGIRNVTDMMSEMALADANEEIGSGVKTIFIPTSNENRNYSSSLVKELLKNGKDVSKYVPVCVNEKLKEKKNG